MSVPAGNSSGKSENSKPDTRRLAAGDVTATCNGFDSVMSTTCAIGPKSTARRSSVRVAQASG